MDLIAEVKLEIEDLRLRIAEVESVINSLRAVGADALFSSSGIVTFGGPEEPYRAFFLAMNEGGLTLDDNGRILYSNPRFALMTGLSIDAMRGKVFVNFLVITDRTRIAEFFLRRHADACESELINQDGTIIPIRISLTPMDIAGQKMSCLVITDLTIQKRFVAQQYKVAMLNEFQRYETLLNIAGDGIHVLNQFGEIVQVNDAFCHLVGYAMLDLLSMNLTQLDVKRSASEVQGTLNEIINHRKCITFETQYRCRNGIVINVEINATGVLIDNQQLIYCSGRDITRRKQMEAQLAHDVNVNSNLLALSKSLIATPVKIQNISQVTLDTSRILTESEHGFVSFIKPETEDNISYAFTKMLEPFSTHSGLIVFQKNSDAEYPNPWGYALNIGQGFYTNQPFSHPVMEGITVGEVPPHGFLSVPVFVDKTLVGQIALANPIRPYSDSDLNVVEQIAIIYALALQRYHIEQELITMRDVAQASASAKSEFLANMSHEIRTPMNGIIGLTQLALESVLSPKVRDYLEKVNCASHGLLRILNDILDYSKIESGLLVLEEREFNLDAMLNTLRHLFTVRAEEKGLAFGIEVAANVPRNLIGDGLRIQQVLTNLIGNAIKFTDHGSVVVTALLNGMEESKARILFSVIDTGIGMTPKVVTNLFHPFTQADATITRRFGGTGLGLSISQNLLNLLDSHFIVESTPGEGSMFSFEILLNVSPNKVLESEFPIYDPPRKIKDNYAIFTEARVLLAEDNLINQQVASEFLSNLGISVTTALNGREVLALLEKDTFDAVLMDVHMPEMDGLEATRELRKNKNLATLPVIALTASVMADEREQAFTCGMNDFLEKPLDPEKLFATLKKYLQLQTIENNYSPHNFFHQDVINPLPNTIPGLNILPALKLVSGQTEIYQRLLQEFVLTHANDAQKITDAIAVHDFVQAQSLIHDLKGVAGSIGASELMQANIEIEKTLKNFPTQNHDVALQRITRSLNEVIQSIKIVLSENMLLKDNTYEYQK